MKHIIKRSLFNIKRGLFNLWYKFEPVVASLWLNHTLEKAENSAANLLRRNYRAADELEIQCEEAGLPINQFKLTIRSVERIR